MIRKILVAHGGAEWSDAAFDFGLELAGKFDAKLALISVVRLRATGDEDPHTLVEKGKTRLKALHERLKKKAHAAGKELETRVAVGHPAEQIIDWAEELRVDLVVLGHRYRNALGRWLVGSVSGRVMDHAPCSCIIVMEKAS